MRVLKLLVAAAISAGLAAVLVRLSTEEDRWIRREGTSALDARSPLAFTLDADGRIRGWVTDSLPTLALACRGGGEIEFSVITRLPAEVEPGDENRRTVRYQFDAEEPVITQWTQAPNRQSLIAPAEMATELANHLATAGRFNFSYVPFNAEPVTATFTLTGVAAHWAELQGGCR
jgi:hypothetical protein